MSKVIKLKSKKELIRLEELEILLNDLDIVGEILYNNLQHGGVFKLIDQLEELRFIYSLEWDAINQSLSKGLHE